MVFKLGTRIIGSATMYSVPRPSKSKPRVVAAELLHGWLELVIELGEVKLHEIWFVLVLSRFASSNWSGKGFISTAPHTIENWICSHRALEDRTACP
jgi:hypothetical protein